MTIDDNSTLNINHEFYQKLYSIRVRRMSYFKLTFQFGNITNYWKSVDVLQGMTKHSNKMIELEMRANSYQSWTRQVCNEQLRDIDKLT